MKLGSCVVGIIAVLGLAGVPAVAEQTSADQAFWKELEKLSWQAGPSEGKIAGKASITIPNGHWFLSAADTSKFLTLLGNLPRQNSYTFAPEHLEWFAVFDFAPTGYVRDDEKLDPDAILQGLKEGNERGNEERKSR